MAYVRNTTSAQGFICCSYSQSEVFSMFNSKSIRICLLLVFFLASSLSVFAQRTGYRHYIAGSSANVSPSTSEGYVFMGGGGDVIEAFQWMIDRSGGGDFVILRADRPDRRFNYYDWVYNTVGGVNSAETLWIQSRQGANSNFVYNTIRNAEAVFIAGGNQYDYVADWKGTKIEQAIDELIVKGVPIGGTSAGMHIMSDRIYDGRNNSSYGSEALEDPYNQYMTFSDGFLNVPYVYGLTTDTHFYERDRMGRPVAFIARNIKEGYAAANNARAMAVDEDTAYCMEGDGYGYVLGDGYAYFLRSNQAATVCAPGQPLTIRDIDVYRINSSGSHSFDLRTWSGSGGVSYQLDAINGTLQSSKGSIY
jgi:cyanophycinase-like exopeptidase